MTLTVLIVDDEKLERVLIRKGYKWEDNGFEVIGEASSGEEALAFIKRRRPDIVVTDINMPHMDGLELSENIKACEWQPRIIMVTGYREFDYARRAVKLGVKDFLLKPVNIEELGETVTWIKEEINQEVSEKEAYIVLKEKALSERDIILGSFLQRLVEGRTDEEEARHKLELYAIEKLAGRCICLNIQPNWKKQWLEEERNDKGSQIIELLSKVAYQEMFYFTHYMGNIIVYLYESLLDQVSSIVSLIKHQINTELQLEVDIGISEIQEGYMGISKAYKQTQKAISARVILGKNSCIFYNQYKKVKAIGEKKIEMDWKDFSFSVQNGIYQKVDGYIKSYVAQIKDNFIEDIDYIKLMTMQMLSTALSSFNKQQGSLNQLMKEEVLCEEVSEIETLEEMNQYLSQRILQFMDYHYQRSRKKVNPVIQQAMAYIDAHLCDEALSLKVVAACIFVNESYLSRIFKQEIGESLIGYITRKRIEQSIELLNRTDLKVYEIADQVGIKDPHYFGICFKKQVGVTIKEYKQSQALIKN